MIEVIPLSSTIGVEVRGIEDVENLTGAEAAELRSLFDAHHLLLFRGLPVSEAAQIALCRYVRNVADAGVSWISNVENGFHPEGRLLFHSDYAFTPWPLLGISLHAVELGEDAAPTYFANTVTAAGTLPADLRRDLECLEIVHVTNSTRVEEHKRTDQDEVRHRLDDYGGADAPRSSFPRIARPALWSHPVTGVPVLFINEQQASHFDGWSCDQSDDLLGATFAHLYSEPNRYEHEWRLHDLLIWDNIALQHGRPRNPHGVHRSLRRVVMSDVPRTTFTAGTGFAMAAAEEGKVDAQRGMS